MSDKYHISKLSDILSLTHEQRIRCCMDIIALGKMADMDKELRDGAGLMVSRDEFTWVDDGLNGEISGVSIGGKIYSLDELMDGSE